MTNYVEYIKSHVESDLEVNKRISGRNYFIQLGMILNAYLDNPQDEQVLVLSGVLFLGKLEEKLRTETGKLVTFHETKKCGLAIHQMWKEGDTEGLAEIKKYADELMRKGLEEI